MYDIVYRQKKELIVLDGNKEKEKEITKEEHVANYIRYLAAIESAIEPFKDQKRELRQEYSDNNWLSKEEIRLAVKAYRLMKSETDIQVLTDYFNRLKKTRGILP